jgi:hypothetical protein
MTFDQLASIGEIAGAIGVVILFVKKAILMKWPGQAGNVSC